MKRMKKLCAVLLALLLGVQMVPVFAADYQSEALNALSVVGEPVDLGKQIRDVQILGNCVDVREDGTNMFYGATSGPPAIFFAYNLDTGEIEDTQYLQNEDGSDAGKVCYGADMGLDGWVNITTQSDAMFFRYNPETKELKNYGKVFDETAIMTRGYVDENNNYYFGTYPNAKLVKWDSKTDQLMDLGRMLTTGDYCRSIVGYGDKIFMSGVGAPTTEVVKYDIKTGKKTIIPNPSKEGEFEESDVASSSYASNAGKYMLMRFKIEGVSTQPLCVFDMEKEEWTDIIYRNLHSHTTDLVDGLIYLHNSIATDSGVTGGLFTYNPETKELTQVEGVELTSGTYIVSPRIVTLADQEKYPGRTLVGGSGTAGIILINLETKNVEYIKDTLPAQATTIRTMNAGYGSDVILSAYMGSKFVIYDSDAEKVRLESPMQQIEDIVKFDNKYYFGRYGRNGTIDEFDPNAAPGTAPTTISTMNDTDQDRVFNIVDAGDYIAYGTYPNYGKLGGNVAIYNKETKETTVFKKPVANQCIAGLAYKDGKLYVSTSIFGGLGIDAVVAPAKMLIMDLTTGEIEKQVDVKLTTDKNEQYFVGDMTFDEDGNLWVACVRTLLKVDPSTLAIVEEIPIGGGTIKPTSVRALPYMLEFGVDGLLYTNLGNLLTAVDTKTSETKELAEISTNAIALPENGNLYYIMPDQASLGKLVLNHGGTDKLTSTLQASTVLFIGSPNALVKGETKQIDPDNSQIVAQTVNDRTLVPVRFIAETYGAQVDWDEASQTATLTLPEKVVTITLNQNVIKINDEEITIDVPAQTFQDRTMLPLRAFVEQVMGMKVFWDDRGLIVISESEILNAEQDADVISQLIQKFQ